jgi:hypothetical protein
MVRLAELDTPYGLALLNVPFNYSAALEIERRQVGYVVARAVGVENEDLLVADAANIVFALENESRRAAVGLDLPFARLGTAGDADNPLDDGNELSARKLCL